MTNQDYKDILVFTEIIDGTISNASLETLKLGEILAEANGEKLQTVVIGNRLEKAVQDLTAYGAEDIIIVEGDDYELYNSELFAHVLVELVGKYQPSVVLGGATINGRDLFARAAVQLNVGSADDCIAVESGENGILEWTRPIQGGNLLETVTFPNTKPQMGTIRQGMYDKGQKDESRTANLVKEDIVIPADKIRTRVAEIIKSVEEGIKLEEAEVVIAAGRGVGGEENLNRLSELAELLGGTVGGTRACVDAGWMSPHLQIGQSGKKISPKLYIGFGISGAIQHTGGITSSDIIVAVNKDPDAPIFEIADYGIVGDLNEVLPVLMEEIKAKN